jgi:hypothetical protein
LWTQIGADIVGPNDGDRFGSSVALTPGASFLTIGANGNDCDGPTNSGRVQTYENQKREVDADRRSHYRKSDSRKLGVAVATSSDGQTIATGGPLGTVMQDANVGEATLNIIIRATSIEKEAFTIHGILLRYIPYWEALVHSRFRLNAYHSPQLSLQRPIFHACMNLGTQKAPTTREDQARGQVNE